MIEDGSRAWRRTLAGVALADILPLVGIVLLDWGLAHLLVVYWVEVTVGGLRRTLEATFAGRRGAAEDWAAIDSLWGGRSPFYSLRGKRGGFRLHPALPPTYPRSFPRVLDLGRGTIGLSFFSGVGLWVVTAGSGVFAESLLVAGMTTLAREGVAFADHVRSRDYRELVPQSILTARSLLEGVALAVVVVWGVALDRSPTESPEFVFVLVYLVRVGFDAYSAVGRSERFDPLDPSEADFEDAGDEEWPPVAVPEEDPTDVFRTDRRAVRLGAVVGGVLGMLNPRRFAAAALPAFFGYVAGGTTWAAVGASAVVAAFVACTLAERDLRWGHLEYRVHEDSVVCYDRLLDEPQWRVERRRVTDATDRSNPLERRLGVSSVSLERRGDAETRTLRFLDAAEPPVSELGRRRAEG